MQEPSDGMTRPPGEAVMWLIGAFLGGILVIVLGLRTFPAMPAWSWLALATLFLWAPALIFLIWTLRRPKGAMDHLRTLAARGLVDATEYESVGSEVEATRRRRHMNR